MPKILSGTVVLEALSALFLTLQGVYGFIASLQDGGRLGEVSAFLVPLARGTNW